MHHQLQSAMGCVQPSHTANAIGVDSVGTDRRWNGRALWTSVPNTAARAATMIKLQTTRDSGLSLGLDCGRWLPMGACAKAQRGRHAQVAHAECGACRLGSQKLAHGQLSSHVGIVCVPRVPTLPDGHWKAQPEKSPGKDPIGGDH